MLGTWEHLCFFRLFHLSSKRPLQFLLTGGELQGLNQVWVLLITVGGTPFILVQEYEKTSIKLADYRNHLHFNLRCSQQWLCKDTPPPICKHQRSLLDERWNVFKKPNSVHNCLRYITYNCHDLDDWEPSSTRSSSITATDWIKIIPVIFQVDLLSEKCNK